MLTLYIPNRRKLGKTFSKFKKEEEEKNRNTKTNAINVLALAHSKCFTQVNIHPLTTWWK